MAFTKAFNEEDGLDYLYADGPGIVLNSTAQRCKVCRIGNVVPREDEKEDGIFTIYTRDGTKKGKHLGYRCNNRSISCRAGHYYGYVTLNNKKCYDKFALKNEYLVTSSQTAFSVSYLWDCLLQILFSNASFESLAKVYNNLHYVNLPEDVLERRVQVHRKRIAEAIFTFEFLEIGARYGVPPIIYGSIDNTILHFKDDLRDKFREVWTVDHKCDKKGCSSVLIVDGGMKPTRPLCAAKLSGVKEFANSGMKVVVGCQKIPQPGSKYCADHADIISPAINAEKVSSSSRMNLRKYRSETALSKQAQQDQVYVVESIMDKKVENKKIFYKIKWLGFPEDQCTWEPSKNIQEWILSYYSNKERYGEGLPDPKIKRIKKAGNQTYYYLSWEGGNGDDVSKWVGTSFFELVGDDGEVVSQLDENESCNTKKTKDKRERRYSLSA